MLSDRKSKRRTSIGRFALPPECTAGRNKPLKGTAGANFMQRTFNSRKIKGGKLGGLSGDFVDRFENHLTTRINDKKLDIFTYGPETKPESPRRPKRSSSVNVSEPDKPTSSTDKAEKEKKRGESQPAEKEKIRGESKPEEKEKIRGEMRPRPTDVLRINNVNLNLTINGQAHHTSKYAISAPAKPQPQLVVRRGQHFSIEVVFSRTFDEKLDDLLMVFKIGDKPLKSRGTYVEFKLSAIDKPKNWGARITSTAGSKVSIDIYTPPNCIVGKWYFMFDVIKAYGSNLQVFRYQHKDPIYMIFNPWYKDDTVYMLDRKLLSEYIMNEFGLIYAGSAFTNSPKPWNFGQFESCVLDIALYVLDKGGLSTDARGDPIRVVRKISAMVNANDDSGVLIGDWSGNYSNGTSPLSWTGSVPILEEYLNGKKPVRFGQCWVYSGLCTTLCRALGIPARSVTNFESAHDTDGSITLDVYFNAAGEFEKRSGGDSIWNFHVWNEVWMSRPDLPPGYGGWQAFDSTPQEISDGFYCGGPTSLVAIRNGDVHLQYDTSFVFAEVNADRLYWRQNQRGVYDCVHMEKKVVGLRLLTKAVDADASEDITPLYKHPEDSPEERAAVLKANQLGSTKKDLYKKAPEEVKFKVVQDTNNIQVGANFQVGLSMKNTVADQRTVNGRIMIKTMFYTGIPAETLLSEPISFVLKSGDDALQNLTVKPETYISKLKDCCMLDVTVLAHVLETDQYFCTTQAYTLQKPQLAVKAPKTVKCNKEFKADVSFKNPFDITLTNCEVSVDGVASAIKFPQGNVAANGPFTATLSVLPIKLGPQVLIIIFNSLQLEDINVAYPITVKTT